jgi:hypothetical protein
MTVTDRRDVDESGCVLILGTAFVGERKHEISLGIIGSQAQVRNWDIPNSKHTRSPPDFDV